MNQTLLDNLSRRYAGQAVDAIKTVLQREWARIGGTISDPELTSYATEISKGHRVVMRFRWVAACTTWGSTV